VSELLGFPREIGLKRTVCKDRAGFRRYVRALNGKSSIYTSVYSFGKLVGGRKVDEGSVIIDRAWWDFDATNKYSIDKVKTDTSFVIKRRKGDVRVIATGRGFHIHQLFSNPVIGRHWARTLDRYQRLMAQGLESLDKVCHPRQICRVPNTYNPKRKRWCVVIDGKAFAENPLTYEIPKKPNNEYTPLHPFLGESVATNAFGLEEWASNNPYEIEANRPLAVVSEIESSIKGVPIPPCLSENISVSNPAHHVRVALVQHLAENLRCFAPAASLTQEHKMEMTDTILGFVRTLGWQDFNETITKRHIATLVGYDNVPSCVWFNDREMCPAKCWRYDETIR